MRPDAARQRHPGPDPEPDTGTGGFGAGWRRGALTNLLNPKVGVFYVAVLPQFIPAGVPHLPMGVLLTSVHVAEGLVWSAVLVAFARAIRGWLRRPAARKLMDRLTGVVVVGFGLRLATTD
ncbi:LysE family translocator [Kitasatospora gansuensis]